MKNNIQLTSQQIESFSKALKHLSVQKKITLGQFKQEYLSFIKGNRSKSYFESNELTFNHMMTYFSGQMEISSLHQKEIEIFLDKIKLKARSGYRVYFRNLKAAFNKGIDWGYLNNNPFKKIKLPKKQANRPEFITEEELDNILKHIEDKALKFGCSKNRKNSLLVIADIVQTAFYTGMRLNELNNLRWGTVFLEKEYLIVGDNKFTTKGKKQRIIPIEKKLQELLLRRKIASKSKADLVFSINGRTAFTNDYVSKTFKSICREVGIDEIIRFHSLRHSFASNLAQKGVSPFQLKELLGHSSVAVTEKYSHLNLDSLREAIKKFDGSK